MRTVKVINKGSINDLKNKYEKDLILFKKHYFNNVHQQNEYRKAVSELKDNECLIVCDFSESYEAKLANEVQSMHFGASKRQISLHTGMVYWKGGAQSFCTMSDENNHQPPAIWAHLSPVIEMIKKITPTVEILHFFTDGPSSQYRQKNNFYLLAHFTKTYAFRYSTWSFYEAHHGKSVADGIGGSVKRNLDKKVCLGVDVADARDAYEVSKECLKKTKVFLVSKSDIDNVSKVLPAKLPILKGTMQLHQIITDENDNTKITYRDVSCFCGDLRGQCGCFSPKSHSVIVPRPIRDCISPLDSCPSTSAVQDDVNLQPIILEQEQEYDIEMSNEESDKDLYRQRLTERCNPENKTLKKYRPVKSRNCKPETKMAEIKTPNESHQHVIEIPTLYQSKIVNFEASERATPGEMDSNCSLPMDLKDCMVKPIFDDQSTEIINMDEFTIITLQQQEEFLQTSKNEFINYMYHQDGTKNTVQTAATSKPLSGNNNDLDLNNVPVTKSCKAEIDTLKSCKNKIKILEVKTYFPKHKELLPGKAHNPVGNNVPSTKRCKSKIQINRSLECQKCFTSISGPKCKCMICKKWFCSECVGQQIYPDYICDPCLES